MVNIPNSMTVLTDLLPVSLIMAERNLQVRDQDEQYTLLIGTIDVRLGWICLHELPDVRFEPVGAPVHNSA